jgi:uncharacterized protein (DUF1778 family)
MGTFSVLPARLQIAAISPPSVKSTRSMVTSTPKTLVSKGVARLSSIKRHQRKIARIEARLNPEQKRRIEYAARLKGTSLSDFMVLGADDAAARAIQEHEVWTLAGRDRELFVRALLNPPAPSASMKAAAQRYKRRLGTL